MTPPPKMSSPGSAAIGTPAPTASAPTVHKLRFTGSGGEYFKIWIVNILLTIVTLGIYSAWAKVKRMQYFYRNTTLDGASFDFHGSPKAILKGRVIAFSMLGVLNVAAKVDPMLYGIALLAIAVALPWFLQRSFRFRLANTSYRGLRFAFEGSTRAAYNVFLLWPLASVITLGLAWPAAHRRIKQFQVAGSRGVVAGVA